jgi:hypothetical protein
MAADRAHDAGIVGWEETHGSEHQQAGVEQRGSVVLGEGVDVLVEAFVTDLGMDPIPQLRPVRHSILWQSLVVLRQSNSPVERHPGHDL